ncbi:hypothetical protein P9112_007849 [Eukaryota sp. TZLM1-RC]
MSVALLSYLDETEPELHLSCLQALQNLISTHWSEIADRLPQIESLAEQADFPGKSLAALTASKIHYELGSYQDAVSYALLAGDLFDPQAEDLFTRTILSECIQQWIDQCHKGVDEGTLQSGDELDLPPRHREVIYSVFDASLSNPNDLLSLKNALGTAIAARSLNLMEKILECVTLENRQILLDYIHSLLEFIRNIEFREKILRILADHHVTSIADSPNSFAFISASRCAMTLGDASLMSVVLSLSAGFDINLTYQISIDIAETATFSFISLLINDVEDDVIRSILSFIPICRNRLRFLHGRCSADLDLLRAIRDSFEPKTSILMTGALVANAFMYSGTTLDTFLRMNLPWMGGATFYAKFTASATLGAIHHGHRDKGRNVLTRFLPPDEAFTSRLSDPYSLGGGCLGLGLVYSAKGAGSREVVNYLRTVLAQATSLTDDLSYHEPFIHGASLGLGLASMGVGDSIADPSTTAESVELLKAVLFNDLTIASESSAIALGLLSVGLVDQAKELVELLTTIAQDSKKPRVSRGCVLGLALMSLACEERAAAVYDALLSSTDAVVRYGGVYALGLAFAGTGSPFALQKLLSLASTDTSDDVKRSAIIMIGYVMIKKPKEVTSLVNLSSRSHNPHLRYGAAMAVGLSNAGTADGEAMKMLHTLSKDTEDFVRQGAFIAFGLVMQGTSVGTTPRNGIIRKEILEILGSKFEDNLVKFGGMVGLGLLDFGGRNSYVSLVSPSNSGIFSNNLLIQNVVGSVLFLQYWFWSPYSLCISLSAVPSGFIGVVGNSNLEIPKFDLICKAKPSSFAYPPNYKPPEKKKVSKAASAVLSVSTKEVARQTRLAKERQRERMEEGLPVSVSKAKERAMEKEEAEKVKPVEPEPEEFEVENPGRVVLKQTGCIDVPESCRFKPILTEKKIGHVILIDSQPDESFEQASFTKEEEKKKDENQEENAGQLQTPQAMRS